MKVKLSEGGLSSLQKQLTDLSWLNSKPVRTTIRTHQWGKIYEIEHDAETSTPTKTIRSSH
jgi:hypothetical protein